MEIIFVVGSALAYGIVMFFVLRYYQHKNSTKTNENGSHEQSVDEHEKEAI